MMRISDKKGSAMVRTPVGLFRGETSRFLPFCVVLRQRAGRAADVSAAASSHRVARQDRSDRVAVRPREEVLHRGIVVVRAAIAGQPHRGDLPLAHAQVHAAIGFNGRIQRRIALACEQEDAIVWNWRTWSLEITVVCEPPASVDDVPSHCQPIKYGFVVCFVRKRPYRYDKQRKFAQLGMLKMVCPLLKLPVAGSVEKNRKTVFFMRACLRFRPSGIARAQVSDLDESNRQRASRFKLNLEGLAEAPEECGTNQRRRKRLHGQCRYDAMVA